MGFLDDLRGKSGKTGLLEKEVLAPTDEGDHERFSQLLASLSVRCVAKNGFQIAIRKNSQCVQHVKRFTPA
jgi:hypothetical protein